MIPTSKRSLWMKPTWKLASIGRDQKALSFIFASCFFNRMCLLHFCIQHCSFYVGYSFNMLSLQVLGFPVRRSLLKQIGRQNRMIGKADLSGIQEHNSNVASEQRSTRAVFKKEKWDMPRSKPILSFKNETARVRIPL